jgi:ABC-type transporter MlaC component
MMIRCILPLIAGVTLLTACTSAPFTQQQPATAEQVVAQIAHVILTVKPGLTYTSETDPNKLLGRPGQYTSKATFTDSRITPGFLDEPDSVGRGGSVEVFPDEQAAQNRSKYVQAVTAGLPAAVEYDYTAGPVLVRVGKALTPAQAGEYQKALNEIR